MPKMNLLEHIFIGTNTSYISYTIVHMDLLFVMDCYIQQKYVYCTKGASSVHYNIFFKALLSFVRKFLSLKSSCTSLLSRCLPSEILHFTATLRSLAACYISVPLSC